MLDQVEKLGEEIESLRKERRKLLTDYFAGPVHDYSLRTLEGDEVLLTQLFGNHSELLMIHNMGARCVYCTLWADGLRGFAAHIMNRCALVLVTPDEWESASKFVSPREWNYPVASFCGTSLGRDMGFEKNGEYWPGYSALRLKEDGTIQRTGGDIFGPGDDYCSIWHYFEMLPNGVAGWEPQYRYSKLPMMG